MYDLRYFKKKKNMKLEIPVEKKKGKVLCKLNLVKYDENLQHISRVMGKKKKALSIKRLIRDGLRKYKNNLPRLEK